MKAIKLMAAALLCGLMATAMPAQAQNTSSSSKKSSSASSILGNVLGVVKNTNVGDVVSSVLGTDKVTESSIVGTWKYEGPGVAFTSENLLSQAGGEVAASSIESKLKSSYDMAGLKSSNTYFTFNEDKTFSAAVRGVKFSGTYTVDSDDSKVAMKSTLLTLNSYVKQESDGLSLMFEADKLLDLLQKVAKVSGNSTLSAISSLSENYDGVRLGFDLQK